MGGSLWLVLGISLGVASTECRGHLLSMHAWRVGILSGPPQTCMADPPSAMLPVQTAWGGNQREIPPSVRVCGQSSWYHLSSFSLPPSHFEKGPHVTQATIQLHR